MREDQLCGYVSCYHTLSDDQSAGGVPPVRTLCQAVVHRLSCILIVEAALAADLIPWTINKLLEQNLAAQTAPNAIFRQAGRASGQSAHYDFLLTPLLVF